jgi:hypothetical protein
LTSRIIQIAATVAIAFVAFASPTRTPAGPDEKSPWGGPSGPPPQVTVVWLRKDGTPIIHYVQQRQVKLSELSGDDIRRPGEQRPRPIKLPTVNGLVLVNEMVEAPLDGKTVRVFGVDGKEIDPKDVRARIKTPTAALLSWDGRPVDPFYLRLAKEGTLVLVGPRAVDQTAPAAAQPPDSILYPDGLGPDGLPLRR